MICILIYCTKLLFYGFSNKYKHVFQLESNSICDQINRDLFNHLSKQVGTIAYVTDKMKVVVHEIIHSLNHLASGGCGGELEPIPALIGREAGYTFYRLTH